MENVTIKSWAEDDRPREKLLKKGKSALSDAELIAIIIGSGNTEETAVDVAKKILKSVGDNLTELAKVSVLDLSTNKNFKGIGEAKAIGIIAALELGRRSRESIAVKKEKIGCSKDIADIFQPLLGDNAHEEFWILLLNRSNKIIEKKQVSSGGVSGTVVDPKMLFRIAIQLLASSMILCHNHPSGNIKPSEADIKLTKQIKEAGKFLEIPVLDHIIITDGGYFSFADEGMM
ncbi:MAG: DNA repair protein RadC [Bacteroidota bacterium]